MPLIVWEQDMGMKLHLSTKPRTIATIITADISDIASSTAFSGGNITDDGGSTVIEEVYASLYQHYRL